MGRFASTVPYYARARPGYGAPFFAAVAARLGLSGRERLLDLGTGPGLLALGFRPFVGEAVGVDPEPAMLAAARAAADAAGVALTLIEGRAECLPADIGRFDLVTIGRALHWMQPGPTRACLTAVVPSGGWVAICRASSVEDGGRNPWLAAYEGVRRDWTRDDDRMMRRTNQASVFAATPFFRRDQVVVETERWVTIDDLADRILSMSSSSPDRIGPDAEPLRSAVRAALRPFAPEGGVVDVVASHADLFQRTE